MDPRTGALVCGTAHTNDQHLLVTVSLRMRKPTPSLAALPPSLTQLGVRVRTTGVQVRVAEGEIGTDLPPPDLPHPV